MIETLQDWNTRLGYCGCCPMPTCPIPVVVAEYKHSGNFSSRTRAVGDEDPDPPPGTSSETRPGGVDQSFAPYTQPAGNPDDLVPTLYQALFTGTDPLFNSRRGGVIKTKQSSNNGIQGFHNLSTWTWTHGVNTPVELDQNATDDFTFGGG